jgi:hypothetical protein
MAQTTISPELHAALARLASKDDLAGLVTKADLEAAVSGVAKNVEIRTFGRSLERITTEIATLREEMAVQTAMLVRLDNTVAGLRGEQRASHALITRALDRVRAVEVRVDTIEDSAV